MVPVARVKMLVRKVRCGRRISEQHLMYIEPHSLCLGTSTENIQRPRVFSSRTCLGHAIFRLRVWQN